MTTNWSVISIMRESLEATLRFAAWYLEAGAERLFLHFDNPDDPAIAYLDGYDRVEVIRCTPGFWAGLGTGMDVRFSRRQNLAMSRTYRRLRSGWVLNVDADELLHVEGGVERFLASAGDDVQGLRILPAEALQTRGVAGREHYFRRPMRRGHALAVYGDDLKYFVRMRFGLTGHPQGKSLTRAGLRGVALRQHWAIQPNGDAVPERILGPRQGAHLLHFADQGFETWRAKLAWRLGSRGIAPALVPHVEAALEAPDGERRMRMLYEKLYCATPDRLAVLDDRRALLRLSLDFEALVEQYFSYAALKASA